MSIIRTLRKYYDSFEWISLSIISHLPTHFIRNILLRPFWLHMTNAVLYSNFHIRKPSNIAIGNGTVIGHGVTLDGRNRIKIGNNVNFSNEVMIGLFSMITTILILVLVEVLSLLRNMFGYQQGQWFYLTLQLVKVPLWQPALLYQKI